MPGEDQASRLLGQVIAGRYRLLEKLGEGAMGAVYLGEHLRMGRRDAIKVLRESQARDPEATARFMRGARNVSAITHPNVCAIYDFSDTEDGLQFMAMEYIQGESLKETLTRSPRLPVERALLIARQVASALDAAHDAGVIHRDLKPGNVMVMAGRDGRDVVKVVDFDIAKGADGGGDEVTRLGFVVGTPEYMSPEQLMGEHLDGRSDLYSLGIMLFRMLAGTMPFQGETTQDMMVQRLTTAPLTVAQVVPDLVVPPRLNALLDHALQRRPGDRLASAEQFEAELAGILAELGHPVHAAPPRPAAPSGATAAATGPTRAAELPSTVVAPSTRPMEGTHQGPIAGPGATNTASRKRGLLAAAALAGVAVIALGGRQLWLRGASDNTTASTETTGDRSGRTPIEPFAAPADSQPAVTTPGPRPVDQQQQQQPTEQRPPATSASRGDDSQDPPGTPTIPAASANDVLFNQLDLLGVPDRSPVTITAVIDTALMIWRGRSMSVRDRALAAYIIGSAYDVRREWPRCAGWLDSAIALNPSGAGYVDLRDKCRRLGR